MRSYLEEIFGLFEEYSKGDYLTKVALRPRIEELVLTGEQILESGITDHSKIQNEYEADKEESEVIRKKVYQTLKELYKKELEKTRRVKKIIQGKKGLLIDEIEQAIK